MPTIIKTQAEWDALPAQFDGYTVVEIRCPKETRVVVTRIPENSSVEALENSSVEARGNSSVVARENSSVVAWGRSSVEARGNSSVVALGNSSVVALENSSVEAWGNSSVVAWGISSVVARENSSVVARGNSSVEAWENSFCRNLSGNSKVEVHDAAIVLLQAAGAKADRKSDGAHILQAAAPERIVKGWLEREGVLEIDGSVILYKRVSATWLTQEGKPWETNWEPGKTLEYTGWNPSSQECGSGKYHACSQTYFCDEFRSIKDDRYIAIRVKVEDLFAWPNPSYPHKIAFRAGQVLHECDKRGKELAKCTLEGVQ